MVNGAMMPTTAKEEKNGQMVPLSKVTTTMETKKALASSNGMMVLFMKEIGKIIK